MGGTMYELFFIDNNNCHFARRYSNMNTSIQKWQLLLKKNRSLLPYKEGFNQRTQLFIS